jgi:transcription factor S
MPSWRYWKDKREDSLGMEFCPKCGSRLEPRKTGEGNSFVLCCAKCGYTKEPINKQAEARTGPVIQAKPKTFLTVVGSQDEINTMSKIKKICEKCGNDEVYVWMVQTRGGDEAMTQFMRCTKCGHTFREYA